MESSGPCNGLVFDGAGAPSAHAGCERLKVTRLQAQDISLFLPTDDLRRSRERTDDLIAISLTQLTLNINTFMRK